MSRLSRKVQALISQINRLLQQYGTMTVRQVYYQVVPYGYNYRQVTYALTKGRELGMVDLDKIIDRSLHLIRVTVGLNREQWRGIPFKHSR